MNIKELIKLKTGGQWLVSPAAKDKIFCRELFSEEHREIEKMVLNFAETTISPSLEKLECSDEELRRFIFSYSSTVT